MRIAVVGVLVDDLIRHPDGRCSRSLGGLAYSVGALAALIRARDRVVPVCLLAADLADRVREEWGRLGNVDREGCRGWEGLGSRVVLDYGDGGGAVGGDRDERLIGETPALTVDDLAPALACDAILLNCITGPVLDRAALAALESASCPVHLDIHSLVLGRDADGRRFPLRPPGWERWVRAATTVQCNEQEASTLAGRTDHDGDGGRGWAREILTTGRRPEAIVVTRGRLGADVHVGDEGAWRVPAPTVTVSDPTGAGDCFGAGFVAARAAGASLVDAVRSGVAAGSAACTIGGTSALSELPRRVEALRPKLPLTRRVD